MAKSPAFRFYPTDFWGSPDVQTMDLHEVGAYLSLLSNAWASERPGMLPDDAEKLRRWSRLTREQWVESGSLLLSKFPVIEDGWRGNPRLIAESDKQQAFSAAQALKGLKGGRPKAGAKPGLSKQKPGDSQTKAHEKPFVSVSASASVSVSEYQEQEQKPSRKRGAKEVDARHESFRLACQTYAIHKGVIFVWDGSEAKALANLLSAAPDLTLQAFQTCLNNRARSPAVVHADRPRMYLGTILSYQQHAKNQFNQPEGTNADTNAKGRSGQTVDAARKAAEILADRFGTHETGNPPTGSQTLDGGLSGIRGGLALLPNGGH